MAPIKCDPWFLIGFCILRMNFDLKMTETFIFHKLTHHSLELFHEKVLALLHLLTVYPGVVLKAEERKLIAFIMNDGGTRRRSTGTFTGLLAITGLTKPTECTFQHPPMLGDVSRRAA